MKATIERVRGGRRAIVVPVHDDGDYATCRYLAEEYEKNDLVGTVAMVANRVIRSPGDELNTEAIAAWQALLDTGRFSISCHSRTHAFWGLTDEAESGIRLDNAGNEVPYSFDAGQITREVRDAGELLRRAFPTERVRAFVKPGFGRHKNGIQISEKAYEIVRAYYITMRNTGGGVETIPARDPYSIRSYMVREGEDAEVWKPYVDEAIEKNGMIVYLFHRIDEEASGLTVAKRDMSRLFAYVGEKKREGLVWVATFEEASLYTEELRAAKVDACETSDGIKVSLRVSLDPSIYDYPLTVRLELPPHYRDRLVTDDGRELTAEDGALLIDMAPNTDILIKK